MQEPRVKICYDCLCEVETMNVITYCNSCKRRNVFVLSLTEDEFNGLIEKRRKEVGIQSSIEDSYSKEIKKATSYNLLAGIIVGLGLAPAIFELKDLLGL